MKAVLWDLNGVIVDDMPYHLRSFQIYLRELGHDMTEEYFTYKCTGTRPADVFADILPGLGCNVPINEAVERKRDIYFDITRGSLQLLPGVQKLAAALYGSGWRQAVASGATRMEVEYILGEFGLKEFYQAVVAAEDTAKGKPDPAPFLEAASRIGVEPASCVVIEDGEYGVRAAKAAGMRVIAVTNTQTPDDLAAADIIVGSLEDIDPTAISNIINGKAAVTELRDR